MHGSWLITGGTGSFARHFIRYVLNNLSPTCITVYSRDEFKQWEMRTAFDNDKIRFVVGDVRDRDAVFAEMPGHDYVIHTAALKHVRTGQERPWEVKKTNVDGTRNVVDAANLTGASMLLLSTDKAVQPVNYYGSSKMLAEGITLAGGQRVARWGNVFGSRGSVLHKFREAAECNGVFKITDRRMTRFVITFDEAVLVALRALEAPPGTVTIPELPAMRITDLAYAFDSNAQLEEIGIQDGEKIAEMLDEHTVSSNARMLTIEEIKGLLHETMQ